MLRLPHVPSRSLQGTASAARVSIEDASPRLSPGSRPTLAGGNAAAQASLHGAPSEFVRAQRSVPTLQPSAAEQIDLSSSQRSQSMMMDALGSRSPIGDMPVIRQWGELRRSGTARLRMTMQRSAFTSDFSSPGSSSARDVDSNVLRRKLVRSSSVTRAARADVLTPNSTTQRGGGEFCLCEWHTERDHVLTENRLAAALKFAMRVVQKNAGVTRRQARHYVASDMERMATFQEVMGDELPEALSGDTGVQHWQMQTW